MGFEENLKEYNKAREKVQDAADKASVHFEHGVTELCRTLMLEFPIVTELGWTQYTPYFNDGDECIFSFHGLHATIIGVAGIYGEDYVDCGDYGDLDKITNISEGCKTALNSLNKKLAGMEELLKEALGDHMSIKITPMTYNAEEVQHD